MNTEKLLRLLFPKTIQKIENDMAVKSYDDTYNFDEEYEMLQAEIYEQERIADEEYRQTLDLGLLQDEEQ